MGQNHTLMMPLKGFIVANGAIDYNYDPQVSALDMLVHFSLIPLTDYKQYTSKKCFV